jgi:hypothetical protein
MVTIGRHPKIIHAVTATGTATRVRSVATMVPRGAVTVSVTVIGVAMATGAADAAAIMAAVAIMDMVGTDHAHPSC